MSAARPIGLAALAGPGPRVLVLGSFPSLISLERGEYYANPRNQFWLIIERMLGVNRDLSYEERCRALTARGIALWDVCESAERPGSLDASINIRSVIPNDLMGLLAAHPTIGRVYMNGRTAATLLDRFGLGHPLLADRGILPSSSPAHAAMKVDDKVRQWSVIAG